MGWQRLSLDEIDRKFPPIDYAKVDGELKRGDGREYGQFTCLLGPRVIFTIVSRNIIIVVASFTPT